MTVELKVEQGMVVAPTREQFVQLIQRPLRTRRERLHLSTAEVAKRAHVSTTHVSWLTAYGARTKLGRIGVSTLAKVFYALDIPITTESFANYCGIGGALFPEALANALTVVESIKLHEGAPLAPAAVVPEEPKLGTSLTHAELVRLVPAALTHASDTQLEKAAIDRGWIVVR